MRVKDLRDLEWTPGLADALVNSLDPAYIEYFRAAFSGASTEKAEGAIAAISEDKRYLTRVLDSLRAFWATFPPHRSRRSESR